MPASEGDMDVCAAWGASAAARARPGVCAEATTGNTAGKAAEATRPAEATPSHTNPGQGTQAKTHRDHQNSDDQHNNPEQ